MKKEKINFINISNEVFTLFEWKPPSSLKSYLLDLNIVRENMTVDIFFHLNRGTMKIAYIRKSNLLYVIGSDQDVQFQLLEAILEDVDEKFNEMYAVDVILSYGNVTEAAFKEFRCDEIIENAENLIKNVDVFCRVCKKTLPLNVKKSLIETASSFPVPIVYNHKGHAVVTYIDQNFIVRGVELVNITG